PRAPKTQLPPPPPRQATADSAFITAAASHHPHHAGPLSWATLALLSWTAVGVIFGDIGTSPLYVYISIFQELGVDQPEKADVLGAASLIFWTLTLEMLVKYCFVVLRADDRGE
ncbi:Potassium transporter 26, partial [Tetrabaena socialis]